MKRKAKITYQIMAQNRDNQLIIKISDNGLFFLSSADNIFSTPHLLKGFSQTDAELIYYIVHSTQD